MRVVHRGLRVSLARYTILVECVEGLDAYLGSICHQPRVHAQSVVLPAVQHIYVSHNSMSHVARARASACSLYDPSTELFQLLSGPFTLDSGCYKY